MLPLGLCGEKRLLGSTTLWFVFTRRANSVGVTAAADFFWHGQQAASSKALSNEKAQQAAQQMASRDKK